MKLFRLAQLSLEYLIFSQNYLQSLSTSLSVTYAKEKSDTAKLKEQIKAISD